MKSSLRVARRVIPRVAALLCWIGAICGSGTPSWAQARADTVLITDEARDVIHRVNPVTGQVQDALGTGNLVDPRQIAVQPGTHVAFVADAVGVKRFNLNTGAFLGVLWSAPPVPLGTRNVPAVRDLAFSPDGRLYVVTQLPHGSGSLPWIARYRIEERNPSTGAVIRGVENQSDAFDWSGNLAPIHITVRPNGILDEWVIMDGETYVFAWNPGLVGGSLPPGNFLIGHLGAVLYRSVAMTDARVPVTWMSPPPVVFFSVSVGMNGETAPSLPNANATAVGAGSLGRSYAWSSTGRVINYAPVGQSYGVVGTVSVPSLAGTFAVDLAVHTR
jgi:hypothetical protein